MAGGGVGEAMLIGAITGAGTSAVTGGDPLKGALLGAAGGGVGAGIAGAGTGAASGTAGGTTAAGTTAAGTTAAGTTAAGTTAAGLDATLAAANAPLTTTAATAPSLTGTSASQAGFGTSAVNPVTGAPVASSVNPFQVGYVDPLAGSQVGASTAGTNVAAADQAKMFPKIADLYAKNPTLYPAAAGAATSAMFGGGPKMDEEEDDTYTGPLSRFKYDPDRYRAAMAGGGLADTKVAKRFMKGGHLGSYSDGGRLLKGPGDGMSDNIPAKIGSKQPARLADGEFVIPADVVSGLGNGSTDAGARRLYAMMDKVRQARTGSKKQGKQINASKYMPA